MVSLMAQSLYLQGNNPLHRLNMMLDWPQGHSEQLVKSKNLLLVPEI
jgi:hypothetical protein